jgi:hypothetical protein
MSWDRRKQKCIALSTAEEEYIATFDVCMEAMWLRKFVSRLSDQVLNSTVIYCDDYIYVNILENIVFHDMSKQIEIMHYIVCDKVQRGELVLYYISTDE